MKGEGSLLKARRTVAVIALGIIGLIRSAHAQTAPSVDTPSSGGLSAPSPAVEAAAPLPTLAPVDLEADFVVSVPKGVSGRLAFSAKVKGFDRIFVVDLDSRRLTPLVEARGNNFAGAWSPDGTRLVFVSDREGTKDLYSVNWDGTDERRLTDTPTMNEDQPSWHPKEGAIIFSAERVSAGAEKPTSNIFSLNLMSGETTQLTKAEGRNIAPRWSPNGEMLAFATNRFWPGWRIVLFNPRTGAEEHLSKASGQVVSQPIYPAAGDRIYFANNTAGSSSIGAYTLSDKKVGAAKYGQGRHLDPAPSPDGEWLAFSYGEPDAAAFNIFILNRTDRSFKPLVTSVYSLRYPSWSGTKGIALEAAKAKAIEAQGETPPQAAPEPSAAPAPSPSGEGSPT